MSSGSPDESRSKPDPTLTATSLPEPQPGPEGDGTAARDSASDKPTVPNSAPVEPPPTKFGSYQILQQIGRGGMGIVYRARDTVLGRTLALKMIRGGDGATPHEVERFYREAKAIANLKHPNIIKIYDFGEVDGRYYFTMDLAEQGSLSRHITRISSNVRTAVFLLEKVARTVQYVHEQNLIHRDLKPGNILLTVADEPVVSDFGLAKSLAPDEEGMTRSGEHPGTTAYMSPEQTNGSSHVSPATDVWALGVMLYELVCGRKPFTGPSDARIISAIQSSDPPEPRLVQPTLDRSLEAVIVTALRKDPAKRYSSAGAFADDLARWQRGEPTRAKPASWPSRFVHRHPRWLAAMIGLALLMASGTVATYFLNPERVLHEEIVPALKRKEPVTLLGETGAPKFSRWIVRGTQDSAPDAPYSIHSGKISLLELLPEPPLDRYRFRAEVRHEKSNVGEVGIYCGRTRHALPGGDVHGYCAVKFADWGTNARDPKAKQPQAERLIVNGNLVEKVKPDDAKVEKPSARVHMDLYLHSEGQPKVHVCHQLNISKQFVPFQSTHAPNWRKLAVEVTPNMLRCFWEGELIGALGKADRIEHGRTLLLHRPILKEARFEFPPRGGLGLYLDESSASFRNVVVEPLAD
jgi:serine/threonine-protein kinase